MMRTGQIVLGLILVASACAWGDETAMQGVGGAISAMKEHPSVVMEKMLVDADVYPKLAKVQCEFTFWNTGKATQVLMGFPEGGNSEAQGKGKQPTGFLSFVTLVDGRVAATRIRGYQEDEAGNWNRWRLTRVPFAAGQRRLVGVRYTSRMGESEIEDRKGEFFDYLVHTGASWKGRIGFGRVRMRLHYDPTLGEFSVGPRLLDRSKQSIYYTRTDNEVEWTRKDFEPTEQDDVTAFYHPATLKVVVGSEIFTERFRIDRYVRRGRLMVPAHHMKEWLGAAVEIEPPQVTLTRGRGAIALSSGKFALRPIGRDERFPPVEDVAHAEVLVPLRRVAEALGANVVYEANRRVVRITYPLQQAVERAFGPSHEWPFASQVFNTLETLSSDCPGWAPPETEDYDQEAAEHWSRESPHEPWLCQGDFDGDGATDIALLLRRGPQFGLAVIEDHSAARKGFVFRWLDKPVDISSGLSGKIKTFLRVRRPERVDYFRGDLEPTYLDLKHDGVEIVYLEAAARLYYWDSAGGRYVRVQTAD